MASIPSMRGIRTSRRATAGRHSIGQGDSLGAIGSLGDNLDVGLPLEDGAEAASYQRLVVGEQDSDHPWFAAGRGRNPDIDAVAIGVDAGAAGAAVEGDPFAHADQPVPPVARVAPLGQLVDDVKLDRVGMEAHLDHCRRAGRVLAGIGERLLDDSICTQVHAGRQRPLAAEVVELHRRPRRRRLVDQPAEGAQPGLGVEADIRAVGSQNAEEAPELVDGLPARVLDGVQGLA